MQVACPDNSYCETNFGNNSTLLMTPIGNDYTREVTQMRITARVNKRGVIY